MRKPTQDTPFLKKARERFKLANESDTDQATRERDDLAFYAGDQWPADIAAARRGQPAQSGMPAIPARPTLVINKVREPVRQVQNEIRDSDIGVELTPADDFGDLGITPDDTEILLREGLVRRTIRDSKGQDAWNWAGDRADIAGRGFFAVMTRYLPGKTRDQEIYFDRIFNQASVKGDPSRTEPDGSDADWWFWGKWMLADRFIAEYPKAADGTDNPFVDSTDADFIGSSEAYPEWFKQDGTGDGKTWSVRVENYAYIERSSREMVTMSDGADYWVDELPDPLPPDLVEVEDSRRTVPEKKIKFSVIGGGVVELEHTDLPGENLPIIETIGEEMHPYDEKRRIEGMVRNARDSQMAYNFSISKWVEQVGLTPIPPIHVDPDAIDTYEAWYAVANTRALPYLPFRTYDDQGRQLAPPSRLNVEPNLLPMAQSIALFDQAIKSTTAVPDPTLGNVDPALKSGRAIDSTVANAKASTSNFVTNRVRSIQRAAEVVNGYLYDIYGTRPGRLVRVMTGEGQPEDLVIGDPEQPGQQQDDPQAKARKVAKLTKDAKFNVVVKITKNFDSRRQQENAGLAALIESNPEFMTWFGDSYFATSDLPGRKGLAERAGVMLAPPIQAMLAEKDKGTPVPPAAAAEIGQLKARLQEAEAAMQELASIAQGKQLEQQTKLQIEQMQGQRDIALQQLQQQTELEKTRMDNATKIHVAEIDAKTKGVIQAQEAEHAAMALAQTQTHEAEQKMLDRDALQRQADQSQAHEAAMGDGSREHESAEAERNRQAASESEASQ